MKIETSTTWKNMILIIFESLSYPLLISYVFEQLLLCEEGEDLAH